MSLKTILAEFKKPINFLFRNWNIIALLAFSLLVRIYIIQKIRIGFHTDSITFLILSDLQSVRTPGYPLFIEALQFMNDLFPFTSDYLGLIIIGQMFLLGILNCFLLYKLASIITENKIFSALVALMYNLDYLVLGFEFQILTETLTISLILLTLLFYQRMFEEKKYAPFAAGFSSAFLLLTKPSFLLLFIALLALTVMVYFRSIIKESFLKHARKAILAFLLINIFAIGSWSIRNKIKYDYFGISTLFPYTLRSHTNKFFHKYKKDDDVQLNRLVDIYLEENCNASRFDERVKHEMHLSDPEIARLFFKMSLKLIMDNPGDYLKQIPEAISKYYKDYSFYWTVPNQKKLLNKRRPIPQITRFFYNSYRFLFKNSVSLIFLIIVMPAVLLFLVRKNKRALHLVLISEGVINYNFFISVLSCNEYNQNLRFRVPVEPLIMMIFFCSLFLLIRYAVVFVKKQ